jgi:hypothetical protein
MTSRQLVVYRCNPVYVWDGTSGSNDKRGDRVHSHPNQQSSLSPMVGNQKYDMELCSWTFPIIGQLTHV